MSQRFAEVDNFNKPKAKNRRSSKRKKKRYEINAVEEVSSNSKWSKPKVETTRITKPKVSEINVEKPRIIEKENKDETRVTKPKVSEINVEKPRIIEKENKDETRVTKPKVSEINVEKPKIIEKENKDELLGHKIIVLQDQVKHFEKLIMEKNKMIKGLKEMNKEIQTENNDVLQMGIQLKHELISQVNAREEELKQFVELQGLYTNIEKKHEKLARQYEVLERKYHGLSQSKLGKLTLRYWEFMNRFRRGQK